MKIMFKIAVLTFLVTGASSQCYAVQFVQGVFTEQAAQGLGVKIRSEVVGTNQVGVWLEFSPHGKLAHFSHGELEVASEGRWLVRATLLPLQQTSDKVVLYFSADGDYIQKSTLTVIVKDASGPDPDGYSFPIKKFVKMPPNKGAAAPL